MITQNNNTPTLDKVMSWDLSSVVDYVSYEHPELDYRTIQEAELEYRYFMCLRASYKENLQVPTKIVDYIWHTHILHTQDYINFSNQISGSYIHHQPVPFTEENFENNSKTLTKMAEDNFGENVFQFKLQSLTPNAKFSCH